MDFILNIDFTILDFIQEFIKNAFLDPVMLVLGYVGEIGAIWILLGIVLLFFRKTRAVGFTVLAALAFYGLVGELGLKHLIARPRPFLLNTDAIVNGKAPTSYSFPSGHTGTSFTAVTVIFAMIKKKWAGFAALALAVIIAFSRLYNYVHYPSDVLCGALLGVLCGIIVVFIIKKTKFDQKLSGELKYKE